MPVAADRSVFVNDPEPTPPSRWMWLSLPTYSSWVELTGLNTGRLPAPLSPAGASATERSCVAVAPGFAAFRSAVHRPALSRLNTSVWPSGLIDGAKSSLTSVEVCDTSVAPSVWLVVSGMLFAASE